MKQSHVVSRSHGPRAFLALTAGLLCCAATGIASETESAGGAVNGPLVQVELVPLDMEAILRRERPPEPRPEPEPPVQQVEDAPGDIERSRTTPAPVVDLSSRRVRQNVQPATPAPVVLPSDRQNRADMQGYADVSVPPNNVLAPRSDNPFDVPPLRTEFETDTPRAEEAGAGVDVTVSDLGAVSPEKLEGAEFEAVDAMPQSGAAAKVIDVWAEKTPTLAGRVPRAEEKEAALSVPTPGAGSSRPGEFEIPANALRMGADPLNTPLRPVAPLDDVPELADDPAVGEDSPPPENPFDTAPLESEFPLLESDLAAEPIPQESSLIVPRSEHEVVLRFVHMLGLRETVATLATAELGLPEPEVSEPQALVPTPASDEEPEPEPAESEDHDQQVPDSSGFEFGVPTPASRPTADETKSAEPAEAVNHDAPPEVENSAETTSVSLPELAYEPDEVPVADKRNSSFMVEPVPSIPVSENDAGEGMGNEPAIGEMDPAPPADETILEAEEPGDPRTESPIPFETVNKDSYAETAEPTAIESDDAGEPITLPDAEVTDMSRTKPIETPLQPAVQLTPNNLDPTRVGEPQDAVGEAEDVARPNSAQPIEPDPIAAAVAPSTDVRVAIKDSGNELSIITSDAFPERENSPTPAHIPMETAALPTSDTANDPARVPAVVAQPQEPAALTPFAPPRMAEVPQTPTPASPSPAMSPLSPQPASPDLVATPTSDPIGADEVPGREESLESVNVTDLHAPSTGSQSDQPNDSNALSRISVKVRESRLLRTNLDVHKATSLDKNICEVVQFSPREVVLVGKKEGITRVDFHCGGDQQLRASYLIAVGTNQTEPQSSQGQYSKLHKLIRELYPDCDVKIQMQGNELVVSGSAKDRQEAIAIITMIRRIRTMPVVDRLVVGE